MSTTRDALRRIEAEAYTSIAPDPDIRNDFRQREIAELNAAAAASDRQRAVLLGIGVIALFYFLNHRRT